MFSSIRPKKSLSQNFLTDESILLKITQSVQPKKNDIIVEIGPGTGNLTSHLIKYNINLHLVEIDSAMIDCLNLRFKQFKNLHIYQKNILKFDFNSDLNIKDISNRYPVKIVSNLPYHLTSPILFYLYSQIKTPQTQMILMMQKEVALRLCAQTNDKNYSRLTVMSQLHNDIEYLFDVSRSSFWPSPKVDSAVLRFVMKPIDSRFANDFGRFIKICFTQKRKKISNNLKSVLERTDFYALKEQSELDFNKRAEQISLIQFLDLFKLFKQFNSKVLIK